MWFRLAKMQGFMQICTFSETSGNRAYFVYEMFTNEFFKSLSWTHNWKCNAENSESAQSTLSDRYACFESDTSRISFPLSDLNSFILSLNFGETEKGSGAREENLLFLTFLQFFFQNIKIHQKNLGRKQNTKRKNRATFMFEPDLDMDTQTVCLSSKRKWILTEVKQKQMRKSYWK